MVEDVSFHNYIKRRLNNIKKKSNLDFTLSSSFLEDLNHLANSLTRHLTKLAIYVCQQRGKKVVQCQDIETAIKILLKHPNNLVKNIIKKGKSESFYNIISLSLKDRIEKTFKDLETFQPTGKKTSNVEKSQYLNFSTTRVRQVMDQVKIPEIKYSFQSVICLTIIIQLETYQFLIDSVRLHVSLKKSIIHARVSRCSIEKLRKELKTKSLNEEDRLPNPALCRFIK